MSAGLRGSEIGQPPPRPGAYADVAILLGKAGGRTLLEYWIPAEDLDELNLHIMGTIDVVGEYR